MTGAAENGSVILAGVSDQVGAGEKAAHTVAKHYIGQAGMLLHRPIMQLFHIPQHIVPAVPGGEETQIFRAIDGFSMAQMVVGNHNIAVPGQKFHEFRIAVNMLGNAVSNLNNGLGFAIGQILFGADAVHACG